MVLPVELGRDRVELLLPEAVLEHVPAGQDHEADQVREGRADAEQEERQPLAAEHPRRLYLSLEEVGGAQEPGDEGVGWTLEDLVRATELPEPPRVHDRDPAAHDQGFLLVASDVDEGDAEVRLHVLELELHGAPELGVQRPQPGARRGAGAGVR